MEPTNDTMTDIPIPFDNLVEKKEKRDIRDWNQIILMYHHKLHHKCNVNNYATVTEWTSVNRP